MKTLACIFDPNTIINTKVSNVKNDALETWEVQSGSSTYPGEYALLDCCRKNKLALQSGHYWYHQHQHRCSIRPPPSVCPVAHASSLILSAADWCDWVRVQGSWSWRGISHPSVASHRASQPCQPPLGETVKTFPFRGVYGAASNNRYQKPPAWNCPLATGRVSLVRRDWRETASIWGLCIQRQLSLLTLSFC